MSVRVECYSGYTYAQEPRAVEWHGRRYAVLRVLSRWRAPDGPGFRVEVTRGVLDLRYIEAEDRWTLEVHTSIEEDQR